MKKLFLLYLLLCIGQALMAQRDNTQVKIFRRDATISTFSRGDVDSIVLKKYNNSFEQTVYAQGRTDKMPLSGIICTSFSSFQIHTGDMPVAEAVDLGLPSGKLWANHNLGATAPEGNGSYFAWGEHSEKPVYNYYYYLLCDKMKADNHAFSYMNIAGTDYDAANVRWGSGWHMPSIHDWDELYLYTEKTDIVVNGVSCNIFKGRNGNFIVMPWSGYKMNEDYIEEYKTYGKYGLYWTSEAGETGYPGYFETYSDVDFKRHNNEAYVSPNIFNVINKALAPAYGLSVRPVKYPEPEHISLTEGESIDLGLSVKWARCNMGALVPEEPGDYYPWGAVESTDKYDPEHCPFYKSATYPQYQYPSYESISSTEYDVAHTRLGGSWRLPSNAEIEELIEKCSCRWIYYKNTYGALFTGPNGNRIFMPASGYKKGDDYMQPREAHNGFFWSGTTRLDGSYPYQNCLKITDGVKQSLETKCKVSVIEAFCGASIRPVTDR